MNKFRIKKVVYNGEKKYIVQKRFMFIFWFKYYHAVEGDIKFLIVAMMLTIMLIT